MKHLAAYLLLHLQNPHPTKKDVEDLLETVDITADPEKLSSLFAALEGKDVMEVYPLAC
jgi:ribosomal protein L12E/L44/L45/RPP1/RPP2